jgi:hypothetical protein
VERSENFFQNLPFYNDVKVLNANKSYPGGTANNTLSLAKLIDTSQSLAFNFNSKNQSVEHSISEFMVSNVSNSYSHAIPAAEQDCTLE